MKSDEELQGPEAAVRRRPSVLAVWLTILVLGVLEAGLSTQIALAQRIENGVAVFAALDKVTARISKVEVKLGTTARFGALKITPHACYERPPTEPPKTTTFVDVSEIQLGGSERRIFSGWMFAESPGLNALEHPVFDLWLTECNEPIRAAGAVPRRGAGGDAPSDGAPQPPVERQRSRPRR